MVEQAAEESPLLRRIRRPKNDGRLPRERNVEHEHRLSGQTQPTRRACHASIKQRVERIVCAVRGDRFADRRCRQSPLVLEQKDLQWQRPRCGRRNRPQHFQAQCGSPGDETLPLGFWKLLHAVGNTHVLE